MADQIAFRAAEGNKDYVAEVCADLKIAQAKLFNDLIAELRNGTIIYDGTKFQAQGGEVNADHDVEIENLKAQITELTQEVEKYEQNAETSKETDNTKAAASGYKVSIDGENLDVSGLFTVARQRRVTVQSVIDNTVRRYIP